MQPRVVNVYSVNQTVTASSTVRWVSWQGARRVTWCFARCLLTKMMWTCSDDTVQVLSNIASLVKDELQYLYELNAMAKELGERYDELSMLRSTDLELTENRESRHILSRYIEAVESIWMLTMQQYGYRPGMQYIQVERRIRHDSLEALSLLKQSVFGCIHNVSEWPRRLRHQ